MSRLSPKATKKINLGDDEWIEIRSSISFDELSSVIADVAAATGTSDLKAQLNGTLALAEKAVVGWCIHDDEGVEVPFDAAQIKNLDFRTMMLVQKEIEELYMPEKKT